MFPRLPHLNPTSLHAFTDCPAAPSVARVTTKIVSQQRYYGAIWRGYGPAGQRDESLKASSTQQSSQVSDGLHTVRWPWRPFYGVLMILTCCPPRKAGSSSSLLFLFGRSVLRFGALREAALVLALVQAADECGPGRHAAV